MTEAMRDAARSVLDEAPPSLLPRSLRREVSLDLVKARFRRYLKDFEWRDPSIFVGGLDMMVVEDWL